MTKFVLSNGLSLSTYCRMKGLSYNAMFYRLKQGTTLEEAVSKPIKSAKQHSVHGMNMKQYCKKNCLNYLSLHTRYRMVGRPLGLSAEEFLDKWLAGGLRKRNYWKNYCEERGLNYSKIYEKWYKRYIDKYTLKEFIDLVTSGVTKTSIEFIPATQYCRNKGYNYIHLQNLYTRTSHRCNTFKDFIIKWERDNGYSSEAA